VDVVGLVVDVVGPVVGIGPDVIGPDPMVVEVSDPPSLVVPDVPDAAVSDCPHDGLDLYPQPRLTSPTIATEIATHRSMPRHCIPTRESARAPVTVRTG
jgi:hypothetical protein